MIWDLQEIVQHMMSVEVLSMCHVHSLPPSLLNVVRSSYKHCQESGSIYGDLLGYVSEKLSAMFKRTHSLQMTFTNLVDKISFSSEVSDVDLEDLCSVINGLHMVTRVVNQLDAKIMITTWKTISKLCSQYKSLLLNHLDISPMLKTLCQEMTSSYSYLFQLIPHLDEEGQLLSQGDDKTFQKSLKILGFQLKIVTIFVKEYLDYLGDSIQELYKLALCFHRSLPPCLTAPNIPSEYRESITTQVMTAMQSLLGHLMASDGFCRLILSRPATDDDPDDGLKCCRCLVLTSLLLSLGNQSGSIQDKWIISPDEAAPCSLVEAVFNSFAHCYKEICLWAQRGAEGSGVGLYELVCTRVSAFIAACPCRYFQHVEQCLLTNVLSWRPHCAMLAVDVWSFLSRYGTADMLWSHCCYLCRLLSNIPFNNSQRTSHLLVLVRRLIKFLSPHQQEALFKTFPVVNNTYLWSVVPMSFLSEDVYHLVLDEAVSHVTSEVNKSLSSHTGWREMINGIEVITNLTTRAAQAHHMTKLVNLCGSLWSAIDVTSCQGSLCKRMLSTLICLTSRLTNHLTVHTLAQICSSLVSCISSSSDASLLLEISGLLRSFASVQLNASFEQGQILSRLPQLFGELLNCKHPHVHQMALQSFTAFAESTVHESVVTESLQQNPTTEMSVVQFLNKVPYESQSFVAADFIHSQHEAIHRRSIQSLQLVTPGDCYPPNKKLKQDMYPDNMLQTGSCKEYIACLNKCVQSLQTLRAQNRLTQDTSQELRTIHNQIGQLLS